MTPTRPHAVIPSPQYLHDKAGYATNARVLKELAGLELRLSREGTAWIKELHRVGDHWTVYVGEGRRLLIQVDGPTIHLMRFGDHDGAYMAARRSTSFGPLPEVVEPDSVPQGEVGVHLLDGLDDDFLRRLGVPAHDIELVRTFHYAHDVYDHTDRLGEDLALRLAYCAQRPPSEVLREYEDRGRDDASIELLTQIEETAALTRESERQARADLAATRAELDRKSKELRSVQLLDEHDQGRFAELKDDIAGLTQQVSRLLETTREATEAAARAEGHASMIAVRGQNRGAKADRKAAKVKKRKKHAKSRMTSALSADEELQALRAKAAPVSRPSTDPTSSMRQREWSTPTASSPAVPLSPGQRWSGEIGRDRWRLSPTTHSMTRLRDQAPLSRVIGADAARRTVDQFLAVRPSGGRVWVDDSGNAVTLTAGLHVYLGPLHVDVAPAVENDGSLLAAIQQVLIDAPESSARELAFMLTRNRGTSVSRADVNALLYGERELFVKDDSTVPRWRLVDTSPRAVSSTVRPAKQATSRRTRRADAYVDLTSHRAPEPFTPAPAVASVRPSRHAPAQVLSLMNWQQQAVAAWYAHGCRGILEAVTGTGKTHVGLEAIAHAAAAGRSSTVLVPSIDLQDQWAARFATFLPHLEIARIGGNSGGDERTADVVIAVVNSATKRDLSGPSRDSLLVADEVHRYGAETFRTALRAGYGSCLGLTATLERSDDGIDQALRPYFGATLLTVGFDRAIREGVVAPFRLIMAPVDMDEDERNAYDSLSQKISNGLKILRSSGALSQGGTGASLVQQLGRLRGIPGRIGAAARSAESAMRERRMLLASLSGKLDAVEELAEVVGDSEGTVLFTQSKAIAEEAAARLREWGVRASALTSDMVLNERRAALADLESGRLQALAAPKLLDEGIDVPSVDLGIVMTASRSRRQMVQRLGRIIRRKDNGRPVNFVILYAANTVEDPADGAHEGFFDLVGEVAQHRLELELGWTTEDL